MNADEMTHIIRAARNLLIYYGYDIDEHGFVIVGSQSIIGSLGVDEGRPEKMNYSLDLDLCVWGCTDETPSDYINGALGEFSDFYAMNNYYADGIYIENMVFPKHWTERAVFKLRLTCDAENNAVPVHFIDFHDLLAAKLYVKRRKDLNFIAAAKFQFSDYVDEEALKTACYDMPLADRDCTALVELYNSLEESDIYRKFDF